MATVISNDKLVRHNVDKYNFKVLALGGTTQMQDSAAQQEVKPTQEATQESNPKRRQSDIDATQMSTSSKDSLIESLLKKTDEMSSNFIKLQMKLEDKEEEYKKEIIKAKEEGFAQGVEAGKAQSLEEAKRNYTNGVSQFATSIATLDKVAQQYTDALNGIKSELITAALDISKEVIKVELSTNSNEIATVLSSELIKELQSASKIKLKVNPKNHGAISEKVGTLAHIEVVSDSAISEGGVIAISEAGNIDSQIAKRFERVKKAALSE